MCRGPLQEQGLCQIYAKRGMTPYGGSRIATYGHLVLRMVTPGHLWSHDATYGHVGSL